MPSTFSNKCMCYIWGAAAQNNYFSVTVRMHTHFTSVVFVCTDFI